MGLASETHPGLGEVIAIQFSPSASTIEAGKLLGLTVGRLATLPNALELFLGSDRIAKPGGELTRRQLTFSKPDLIAVLSKV